MATNKCFVRTRNMAGETWQEMTAHEHFLAGLIFIIGVLTLLIEVLF